MIPGDQRDEMQHYPCSLHGRCQFGVREVVQPRGQREQGKGRIVKVEQAVMPDVPSSLEGHADKGGEEREGGRRADNRFRLSGGERFGRRRR